MIDLTPATLTTVAQRVQAYDLSSVELARHLLVGCGATPRRHPGLCAASQCNTGQETRHSDTYVPAVFDRDRTLSAQSGGCHPCYRAVATRDVAALFGS